MATSLPPVNQPRTILGPLTTTFTPPNSCANVFYMTGSTSEYWYGRTGWRAQSCVGAFGNTMIDATQCWPPTTAGAAYPSPPFSGWGFYSPRLACPYGHTSACEATANGSAQWPVQYALEEGETAVGCCPTGYTCVNEGNAGASCLLTATSTVVTMASCHADSGMVSFLETYPLTTVMRTTAETTGRTGGDRPAPLTSTITTTIRALTASAPMIQINWRSTDLTTTPTSALSDTTGTNAGPTTTTGNDTPKRTLTVGGIIGITISCVAVLLLACVIAWYILRRRRLVRLRASTQKEKERPLRIPQPLQKDRGHYELAELESPRKAVEMTGASELEPPTPKTDLQASDKNEQGHVK